MESFLFYSLDELPFVFIALAIAFTVHEFAHAATAYWFGDDTAKAEGRVTLDPRKHLDWLGTILVLLAGFGWAKPVPVNRARFKNPQLMGAVVTFAGPISNFLLCAIGVFVLLLIQQFGLMELAGTGGGMALMTFLTIFINLNLTLFLFNLIPLPPLDGFRTVQDLAPRSLETPLERFEPYGYAILFLLFVLPAFRNAVLGPLYEWGGWLLAKVYEFYFLFL